MKHLRRWLIRRLGGTPNEDVVIAYPMPIPIPPWDNTIIHVPSNPNGPFGF